MWRADHARMTRQVGLSDDVYFLVRRLRKAGETMPDVIRRLAEGARAAALESLWGSWDISKEEGDRITAEIYARRKRDARGSSP